MTKKKVLLIFFTVLSFSCFDSDNIPNYEKFRTGIGNLNYRILYPKNFDKSKKYPVILFLHGIGERGDDNELQLKYVDKVFLDSKNYDEFRSVVIFPQAPLDDNWSSRLLIDDEKIRYVFPKESTPTKSLQLVTALIDSISI